MTDMTHVRKQIKQARSYIASGELTKARAALKGVDHPKAREMLTEVEAQLGDQPSVGFPVGRMLALVGMVVILGVGGWMLFSGEGEAMVPVMPTLAVIPTSDCTPETVQTWWRVQNAALDTFTAEASSASRTMPGERLDERLAALRQFRADFPAPPECASSEFRLAVADLLAAMDDTIAALTGWSDGSMDGLAVTTALQEAEVRLRETRSRLSQLS